MIASLCVSVQPVGHQPGPHREDHAQAVRLDPYPLRAVTNRSDPDSRSCPSPPLRAPQRQLALFPGRLHDEVEPIRFQAAVHVTAVDTAVAVLGSTPLIAGDDEVPRDPVMAPQIGGRRPGRGESRTQQPPAVRRGVRRLAFRQWSAGTRSAREDPAARSPRVNLPGRTPAAAHRPATPAIRPWLSWRFLHRKMAPGQGRPCPGQLQHRCEQSDEIKHELPGRAARAVRRGDVSG